MSQGKVHLPGRVSPWGVQYGVCHMPVSRVTNDPDEVTCKVCRRTSEWEMAKARAMEVEHGESTRKHDHR